MQFLHDSQESGFDFGESRQPSPHCQPKPLHNQGGRNSNGREVNGKELWPCPFQSAFSVQIRQGCSSLWFPVLKCFFYCLNNTKLTTNTTVDWQRQVTAVEQAKSQTIIFGTIFHHYFWSVSQQTILFSHSHLVPSCARYYFHQTQAASSLRGSFLTQKVEVSSPQKNFFTW